MAKRKKKKKQQGRKIKRRVLSEEEREWLHQEIFELAKDRRKHRHHGLRIIAWVSQLLSKRYESGYQCGWRRARRGTKKKGFDKDE
jgi:hypothetical protein